MQSTIYRTFFELRPHHDDDGRLVYVPPTALDKYPRFPRKMRLGSAQISAENVVAHVMDEGDIIETQVAGKTVNKVSVDCPSIVFDIPAVGLTRTGLSALTATEEIGLKPSFRILSGHWETVDDFGSQFYGERVYVANRAVIDGILLDDDPAPDCHLQRVTA